jgi:hypothetical protein
MDSYDSGFGFGCWALEGKAPWLMRADYLGGSVKYPYQPGGVKQNQSLAECSDAEAFVVKGNVYANFTHPFDLGNRPWVYWDNPLLPEFMLEPEHMRKKQWCRLVFGSIFPGAYQGTEQDLAQAEARVNRILRDTKQAESWRDIVKWQPQPQGDKILFLEPSEGVCQAYYGVSLQDIRFKINQECVRQGVSFDTKPKAGRNSRVRVRDVLSKGEYLAVIGVHSAAACEVLTAGLPYISLGQSAFPSLHTTWQEFTDNKLKQPDCDAVMSRCRELLAVTRNKWELLSGSWSTDQEELLFETQHNWELYGHKI